MNVCPFRLLGFAISRYRKGQTSERLSIASPSLCRCDEKDGQDYSDHHAHTRLLAISRDCPSLGCLEHRVLKESSDQDVASVPRHPTSFGWRELFFNLCVECCFDFGHLFIAKL